MIARGQHQWHQSPPGSAARGKANRQKRCSVVTRLWHCCHVKQRTVFWWLFFLSEPHNDESRGMFGTDRTSHYEDAVLQSVLDRSWLKIPSPPSPSRDRDAYKVVLRTSPNSRTTTLWRWWRQMCFFSLLISCPLTSCLPVINGAANRLARWLVVDIDEQVTLAQRNPSSTQTHDATLKGWQCTA